MNSFKFIFFASAVILTTSTIASPRLSQPSKQRVGFEALRASSGGGASKYQMSIDCKIWLKPALSFDDYIKVESFPKANPVFLTMDGGNIILGVFPAKNFLVKSSGGSLFSIGDFIFSETAEPTGSFVLSISGQPHYSQSPNIWTSVSIQGKQTSRLADFKASAAGIEISRPSLKTAIEKYCSERSERSIKESELRAESVKLCSKNFLSVANFPSDQFCGSFIHLKAK